VDEHDDDRGEDQVTSEPITERVRIVGAEQAAVLAGEQPPGESEEGGPTRREQHYLGFVHGTSAPPPPPPPPPPPAGDGGTLAAVPPEMPHWADPPTGQVPAVIDRRADDTDEDAAWSAFADSGPVWREQEHEWEDTGGFEPAMLADEETRVGALEEAPAEERRPWEFDDLTSGPTEAVRPAGQGRGSPSWGEGASTADVDTAEQQIVDSSKWSAEEGSGSGHPEPPAGEAPGGSWRDVAPQSGTIDGGAPAPTSEGAGAGAVSTGAGAGDAPGADAGAYSGPGAGPGAGSVAGAAVGASSGAATATATAADAPSAAERDAPATSTLASAPHTAVGTNGDPVVLPPSGPASPSSPASPAKVDAPAPEGEPDAAPLVAARERRRTHVRGAAARQSRAAETGARNLPVAIATGVGFAAVGLACFAAGALATLVLATVVVTLAVAEIYASLRRVGMRPATLLGLVATVAVMVTAYSKGVAALPLVMILVIVTSMLWYLVGAERTSPVEGITATVLGFAWVGLMGSFAALILAPSIYPHRHGVAFVLGAVVATVGSDVGALAVGSWMGRHQLAPHVSPNKTWEGWIGGAIVAIGLSVGITGHVHPWTPSKAAILGVVVAVVAPLGDLCESLVKRDLGLKDMGSLLPGHGGVLDRIDGLLFVLPATYYLVRVLNLG
jgi:phosphatidate cytidylyltransferase